MESSMMYVIMFASFYATIGSYVGIHYVVKHWEEIQTHSVRDLYEIPFVWFCAACIWPILLFYDWKMP